MNLADCRAPVLRAVQYSRGMLQLMKSRGAITQMSYNADTLRLRLAFDTDRIVVFYRVPPAIEAMLARTGDPDAVFASHVLGKFAWTEVGVPSFP